jgi:hypothetical protein
LRVRRNVPHSCAIKLFNLREKMRFLIFCVCLIGIIALLPGRPTPTTAPELSREERLAAANDPVEVAKILVDNEKAAVSGERQTDRIVVTFNLAPWSLSKSTADSAFRVKAVEIIKTMFSRFPDVKSVTVAGMATFKDLKGHESNDMAERVTFTRSNADSINWPKFDSTNLFKVADVSWRHPDLDR